MTLAYMMRHWTNIKGIEAEAEFCGHYHKGRDYTEEKGQFDEAIGLYAGKRGESEIYYCINTSGHYILYEGLH